MLEGWMRLFREDKLPHIWCPGCGHGIVTGALLRAVDSLGLDQNKTVVISGIGCSSRAPGYLDFDTLHTTHGRAIPYATGIKLARPELNVIVVTGDGDCAAIGGNHFIHGARRNIDITVVVFNNQIYGMTSGQYSPLTPTHGYASTSPYGNIDRQFDLANLAIAAGATYVARGTTYHARALEKHIKTGLAHKGFAVIEALSQCPTYFGRRNKLKDPVAMLNWQKEHAVDIKRAQKMSKEELVGKIIIGEFKKEEAPEYTESVQKIRELAREVGS